MMRQRSLLWSRGEVQPGLQFGRSGTQTVIHPQMRAASVSSSLAQWRPRWGSIAQTLRPQVLTLVKIAAERNTALRNLTKRGVGGK